MLRVPHQVLIGKKPQLLVKNFPAESASPNWNRIVHSSQTPLAVLFKIVEADVLRILCMMQVSQIIVQSQVWSEDCFVNNVIDLQLHPHVSILDILEGWLLKCQRHVFILDILEVWLVECQRGTCFSPRRTCWLPGPVVPE